jgi:endonuclease/exonuclease/phosphatase family metal-dependent hydrolase
MSFVQVFAVLLALCVAAPAVAASEPIKNKTKNVEVANLNILHGFACDPGFPDEGDQCRVVERMDRLIEEIAAAGCPDIVTLQENVTDSFVLRSIDDPVGPLKDTTALIRERLPRLGAICGFEYGVVFDPLAERPPRPVPLGRGVDEELILSRYPVSRSETLSLYSALKPFISRHVLFARIEHPEGPIDVFTTHLASSSDLASEPCGVVELPPPLGHVCPAECEAFVDTVRECQAKQMALFVEARHDVPGPAILSGDFNAEPGSAEYHEFTDRGWIDSHLAAGNAECDPASGEQCTSGRVDSDLSSLESPELGQVERIDFIFVVPPRPGARCAGVIQRFAPHPQRPAATTGLFAGAPRLPCGAAPLPTCFVSDHSGNQLNLGCQP